MDLPADEKYRDVSDKDVIEMYIAKSAGYKPVQNTRSLSQNNVSVKSADRNGGSGTQPAQMTKGNEGKAVSLELSEEGKALSGKRAEQEEAEKLRAAREAFREKKKKEQSPLNRMLSKSQSAGQKKKKSSNNALSKALTIARRIMRGDKVPPKDESFLFRYNSDLYLKAKMMAIQNKEAEKHKSLLEDEEEEGGGMSGSSSPAPSGEVSSGGESSSGGEEGSDEGSEGE